MLSVVHLQLDRIWRYRGEKEAFRHTCEKGLQRTVLIRLIEVGGPTQNVGGTIP